MRMASRECKITEGLTLDKAHGILRKYRGG